MTATAEKKPMTSKKTAAEKQEPTPIRAEKLKKSKQITLAPSEFKLLEHARAEFNAEVGAEVDFDDVLKPEFWANVVHTFKPNPSMNIGDSTGALIYLGAKDHAFFAQLYVTAVLQGGLVVTCVGPQIDPKTGNACAIDLETGKPWAGREVIENDVFKAEWNSGKSGYDLVRKSDNAVMVDGYKIKTRKMAKEWVEKSTYLPN